MPDINELSERELEILNLIATGATNKEIARDLHISANTVKVHLRNIFSKLEVSSRTEAAMFAVSNGLVEGISFPGAEDENGHGDEGSDGSTPAAALDAQLEGQRRFPLWAIFVLVALLLGGSGLVLARARQMDPAVSASLPVASDVPQWLDLAALPTPRSGLALASYENDIYAIAGEGADGMTGVVERYDADLDRWEALTEKPTPVGEVSAAVIGGKIYIPGGRLDSGEATDILEIYDPRQDRWSSGQSLPLALSAYGLVAFEGKLYLFGGFDGQNYLSSVYEYEPGQDRWRERSAMPGARAYPGAVVAGGKVYVIGGYDGQQALKDNDLYAPEEEGQGNPWHAQAPLPEGRYSMGIAGLADNVYVVGGKGNDGAALPFLRYQMLNDSWEIFDPRASSPWYDGGLAILGTNLHVLGGIQDDSLTGQHLSYKALYVINLPVMPR